MPLCRHPRRSFPIALESINKASEYDTAKVMTTTTLALPAVNWYQTRFEWIRSLREAGGVGVERK